MEINNEKQTDEELSQIRSVRNAVLGNEAVEVIVLGWKWIQPAFL